MIDFDVRLPDKIGRLSYGRTPDSWGGAWIHNCSVKKLVRISEIQDLKCVGESKKHVAIKNQKGISVKYF